MCDYFVIALLIARKLILYFAGSASANPQLFWSSNLAD
jgi:hypothetical protein